MNVLIGLWNWLVYSSANEEQVSLTVKGTLTGLATGLSVIWGFGHVGSIFPSDLVATLINNIITIIQETLLLVSTLTASYGLVRKLWTTLAGTNAVLNQPQV